MNKSRKSNRKLSKNEKYNKQRSLSKKKTNKKPFGLGFHKTTKTSKSYSPTVNRQLVTLKTTQREEINACNIKEAYQYKEPLKLLINDKCFNYNENEAKKQLLINLSANKHINPELIIPPKQILANCWFNTMFVSFFVSDKGRKFFHFLRQLMIEGKQINGIEMTEQLQNAFALLNFAIDSCLTGNKYSYSFNTNNIIKKIYDIIPANYKRIHSAIVDVDEASNPILYYIGIIDYLKNNALTLVLLRNITENWKNEIKNIKQYTDDKHKYPHILVFEIYDNDSEKIKDKPLLFSYEKAVYKLDSVIVRDISKQHFCAMITCEKEDYGYDGMSYHRLVKMDWKKHINDKDFTWTFEGSQDYDKTYLKWNFMKSYQMLIYYRIK